MADVDALTEDLAANFRSMRARHAAEQKKFRERQSTAAQNGQSASASFPQTTAFPLPGEGLYELDRITILGVQLPLEKMPEGALVLDVDKKKEPGSDYSTFVSQGFDADPIKIVVLLWRDQQTGKDWFAEWDKVKDKIVAKNLNKRNAVSVYHPILHLEGVDSLLIKRKSFPILRKGLFFAIELEGYDPRRVRQGGHSKKVEQDKTLRSRAGTAAQQDPSNAAPVAAAQKGKP